MKTYLTLSTLFISPIFSQVIKTSDYVRFINRNAGQKILFVNDTEGKAYCSGPGCDCAIRFDYKTISPGRIQMEFRKEADYGDRTYCVGHFGSKTNQCIVVVAENEPLYKNQLQCEETTYWNVNSTPVNTSVDIAGQSVVYLGDVEGIVTDAVKTRIAPDSTAEMARCSSDETPNPISALPKKTKLIVLARTQNKVKIQSWSNYWYYVKSFGESGYSCSFSGGKTLPYGGCWVYGQFIKLKQKH